MFDITPTTMSPQKHHNISFHPGVCLIFAYLPVDVKSSDSLFDYIYSVSTYYMHQQYGNKITFMSPEGNKQNETDVKKKSETCLLCRNSFTTNLHGKVGKRMRKLPNV